METRIALVFPLSLLVLIHPAPQSGVSVTPRGAGCCVQLHKGTVGPPRCDQCPGGSQAALSPVGICLGLSISP